ncbi:MAG: DUF445 family protein [Selenomonadaceae bacterium]|nr:DUF445 family protein [Selenomonadaceae bacterium]
MIWHNWNKADKTLLAAAVMFVFSLCMNIQYPGNVLAKGFMFCMEAALVGGIADWFAVTALFEKPLGFPYHTAILPRRRQQFMDATGEMLKKEFFSQKKLLSKAKGMDFGAIIAAKLAEEAVQDKLAEMIFDRTDSFFKSKADVLAGEIYEKIQKYPADSLIEELGRSLEDSPRAQAALREAACRLYSRAESNEFKSYVIAELEAFKEKKLSGRVAMMMAGMAQSMNILNIPEAAGLVQRHILQLLEELMVAGSDRQRIVLAALADSLKIFKENLEIKQELEALKKNLLSERTIRMCIASLSIQENRVDEDTRLLIRQAIAHWAALLSESEPLKLEVSRLCYDVAARGLLQAQDMLGNIVREVLATMTDKQVNSLVYDKVETDLLWIRMNGSIVGASIGLCIFTCSQILGL